MAIAWGSYSRTEAWGKYHSLSMPSGLTAGNTLLMVTASLEVITAFPSGWTQLYRRIPGDIWGQCESYLVWRIATGSEGDQSFTLEGDTNFTAVCIRLTGASEVAPIHKYDSAELSSPNYFVTCPSLTPDIANTYGVVFGHSYYEKHDSFSDGAYSSQFFANWGTRSGNGYLAVASGNGPAAGVATGTKSFASSTGDTISMVGGHVLIAPPSTNLLSGSGFIL